MILSEKLKDIIFNFIDEYDVEFSIHIPKELSSDIILEHIYNSNYKVVSITKPENWIYPGTNVRIYGESETSYILTNDGKKYIIDWFKVRYENLKDNRRKKLDEIKNNIKK